MTEETTSADVTTTPAAPLVEEKEETVEAPKVETEATV